MTLECKVRTARGSMKKGNFNCHHEKWWNGALMWPGLLCKILSRKLRSYLGCAFTQAHRHMQEWVGEPLDTRVHDVSFHKFWYKLCVGYHIGGVPPNRHMSTCKGESLNPWTQSYRMLQNICWELFFLTYLGCASDHSYHSCWIVEHGRSRLTFFSLKIGRIHDNSIRLEHLRTNRRAPLLLIFRVLLYYGRAQNFHPSLMWGHICPTT